MSFYCWNKNLTPYFTSHKKKKKKKKKLFDNGEGDEEIPVCVTSYNKKKYLKVQIV